MALLNLVSTEASFGERNQVRRISISTFSAAALSVVCQALLEPTTPWQLQVDKSRPLAAAEQFLAGQGPFIMEQVGGCHMMFGIRTLEAFARESPGARHDI